MKIEREVYILAKEINGEDVYLTEEYGFDNNIHYALKAKNIITAKLLIEAFEYAENTSSDLKIIPLKITYEW